MDKMKLQTPDLVAENVEKIAELFPNCVTETKGADGKPRKAINFDMLRQMLSDYVVEGDEAYEFTWVGKKAAIVEANRPIRKTLRPCPEESKDWDTTQNLYIEGDNLEVLKLLQESYLGKVKMIYIDPPYNTGNDFIYRDNFAMGREEWSEESGEWSEDGERLFRNTESNGRFHSDWCSMIYARLLLARNLLADDGVIFISIDDNEQKNLKNICDEIFGEKNFIAQFVWEKRVNRENRKEISVRHDYVLCYSKREVEDMERRIFQLPMNEKALSNYSNPDNDPRGPWKSDPAHAQGGHGTPSQFYTLVSPNGKRHELPSGRCWLYTQNEMEKAISENRIWFGQDGNGVPRIKTYLYAKERGLTPETILFANIVSTNEKAKNDLKDLFNGKAIFDTPKPFELIKLLLQISSKGGVILDFFSGAASSAHAVMHLNAEDNCTRQFIMVQLQEPCPEGSEAAKAGYKNICEIGKERIRRAGEKIKSEKSPPEAAGQLTLAEPNPAPYSPTSTPNSTLHSPNSTLDIGFRVFKVDESNMKDVYYAPGDIKQTELHDLISNIKEDRTDLDLLFGCLLDWGLPLSLPHTQETISGCTVHTYNGGDLIACFDENIPESVIREIAKRKPLRAVFRDSGFADDPAKINVLEIFKHYMPESADDIRRRVKVI